MHKKRRRPVHHPLLVPYLADIMEKLTSQAKDREKRATLDETKNRQSFCSFNTSLTLWYDIS